MPSLVDFMEDAIRDRVSLVALVRHDYQSFEGAIDELAVGDASEETRSLTTSSHPDETIDEVRAFVSIGTLGLDSEASVQEVHLAFQAYAGSDAAHHAVELIGS